MLRAFLKRLSQKPFERGAAILIFTSTISYALGLIRDRVLAGTFGASNALDAYQASFIIPDFIFNLFVAGALTAAFLPVFTDLNTKHKHQQAAKLAGTLLSSGLVILIVVDLSLLLFIKPLAGVVAPGFDPSKQVLLSNLTRIMLLSPLLFLTSNLFGNMLVSTKRFLFYGLSPAFYNLGIILGILILSPAYGIYSAAIGTIIGATLHLSIRLIDLYRAGLKVIPDFKITPELKKVVRLMLPRIVGLTAVQIQLWAFVAIASTLGEGAVTIYSLARNFQSFPVSLIGIALATSLFPILAESASRRAGSQFSSHLTKGVLATLALVIPAALLIYMVRVPIISFFVGTGKFGPESIAATAFVLGIYTISIPAESLVHILARGFYALHNTLLPVIISIISIIISIVSASLFSRNIGVAGIPAGFAIGTTLQAFLLILVLKFWTNKVFTRKA